MSPKQKTHKTTEPKVAVCRFCEYSWVPRTSEPKACPYCKRYGWKG